MDLSFASSPSIAVIFAAARAVAWVIVVGAVLPRFVVPPGRIGPRVTWCVLVMAVDVAVWSSGIPDAFAVAVALGMLSLCIGAGGPVVALRRIARRGMIWAVNRARPGMSSTSHVRVMSDRPATGGRADLRVTLAAWARIVGSLVDRFVRMWRREGLGTLSRIALIGVAVSLWRMLRDRPLAPGEVSQILAREGWISRTDVWVTDTALGDLARRLLATSPAVAAVACTAPIVLVASWSGLAALRRYRGGHAGAAWPGALAGAAIPLIEVASGAPASPTLVAGAQLGWGIAVTFGGAPEAIWAWPIGMALLHPLAGGAAALVMLAAVIHAPAASEQGRLQRLVAGGVAVATLAFAAAWLFLHDRLADASAPLPLALGIPFFVLAGAAALALLLMEDRSAQPGARARTRALAVATVVATVVAAMFPTPFDVQVAASLGVLTVVTAVITRVGLPSKPASVAAAAVCLLASWVVDRGAPQREPALVTRDAIAIELALRARHLRREFTVIGPQEVLPAFAGEGWFIAEQNVPSRFDPSSYRFDAAHPEWIIQTEHTYVLVNESGETALTAWLDDLARMGIPTPTVDSLSRGPWRVRDLVRPRPEEQPTAHADR